MSGAVPPPAARPLERAARVPRPVCPGCGRCGRVDPAPAPQRAPLRAGVARCGAGGRVSPGGGAFHRCEGRLVSGAVPHPAACPLERAARVPRPVCPGCGRCGRVDPAPAPQRAPLRAGVARCGGGGGASPGGGAFHRCEGRLVSGAVPPPAARPLERAAWVPVCVCVRVRALLGRVGRAGLPGAFLCQYLRDPARFGVVGQYGHVLDLGPDGGVGFIGRVLPLQGNQHVGKGGGLSHDLLDLLLQVLGLATLQKQIALDPSTSVGLAGQS